MSDQSTLPSSHRPRIDENKFDNDEIKYNDKSSPKNLYFLPAEDEAVPAKATHQIKPSPHQVHHHPNSVGSTPHINHPHSEHHHGSADPTRHNNGLERLPSLQEACRKSIEPHECRSDPSKIGSYEPPPSRRGSLDDDYTNDYDIPITENTRLRMNQLFGIEHSDQKSDDNDILPQDGDKTLPPRIRTLVNKIAGNPRTRPGLFTNLAPTEYDWSITIVGIALFLFIAIHISLLVANFHKIKTAADHLTNTTPYDPFKSPLYFRYPTTPAQIPKKLPTSHQYQQPWTHIGPQVVTAEIVTNNTPKFQMNKSFGMHNIDTKSINYITAEELTDYNSAMSKHNEFCPYDNTSSFFMEYPTTPATNLPKPSSIPSWILRILVSPIEFISKLFWVVLFSLVGLIIFTIMLSLFHAYVTHIYYRYPLHPPRPHTHGEYIVDHDHKQKVPPRLADKIREVENTRQRMFPFIPQVTASSLTSKHNRAHFDDETKDSAHDLHSATSQRVLARGDTPHPSLDNPLHNQPAHIDH
jgi:hypothetical protein